MIDLTKFGEIMVSQSQTGKFPCVEFSNGNSLKDVIKRLEGTGMRMPADLSGSEIIGLLISNAEDAQKDEFVGLQAYQMLEEISKSMADNLGSTLDTISSIKDESTHLCKLIDTKYDELLRVSKVGVTRLNLETEKGTYKPVDWTLVTKVAPAKFIVAELHEGIKTPDGSVSKIFLNKIIQRYVNTNPAAKLVDVDISESKDELFELVKSKTELVESDIKLILSVFADKKKGASLCNKILNLSKSTLKYGESIVAINKLIRNIVAVQSVIAKADDIDEAVVTNSTIVLNYLKVGCYFIMVARNNVYVTSILLDNKMINPDMIKEFETEGLTESDITRYIHYMVTTGVLPSNGVTVGSLKMFFAQLRKRAKTDTASVDIRLKLKLNTVKRDAMIIVLDEYISKNKEDILTGINSTSIRNIACDNILLDNVSCEDIIFTFIINLLHGDSFVKTVYSKLGASYTKRLTEVDVLEKSDVSIIEMSVFVELILDFILTKFCK